MYSFSVITMLAVLSAIASHFVKASENPVSAIPGYTMETLQWSVDVFPGQTELLNGTVQEVYAQALQINPHFELSKTDGMDLDETTPDIQNSVIHCGIYRPRAEKGRILEGVRYLHSLPGRPKIRPGPRRCVRVSCSYGGAIVWCNDRRAIQTFDSWRWIANSAQHIVKVCGGDANSVSGQNLELGDWNTNVLWEDC